MKNLLKKSLAAILALLLSLSLAVISSADEETTASIPEEPVFEESKMGDIDGNGQVSASDARILLRCAVKLEETTEYILLYGDFDKDGKISADDARIVLRIAVRLDSAKCILHGHEIYDAVTSPTCTSDGFTLKLCRSCSHTDNEKYDVTAAKGHSLKEETTTATCTADAVFTSVCTVCGFVAEEKVVEKAHGHEIYDLVTMPTCTTQGYTLKFCKNCSYADNVKYNVTAAKGHSLKGVTTKATCTADGVFTSSCSVCGYVAEKKVVEKAHGHDFGVWQLNGETKTKTCKKCSYAETAKNVKTIYLTFDDGPGAYTEKLLRYLKEYNVKATFFVTNQIPGYRYVLKSIVNDGHAIAVHTLTHQWSIYSSQTSYLNDFNAMHKIILDDTGVDTKIFRFPGGTNNTVSKSYSKGIMSAMAKYMTNAGYIYFDWNVDSGDTQGYSATKIAENTIAQIKKHHHSVVLMHDIKYNTVEAIRTIIKFGLDNGYKFEVIDQSTPRVQFSPAN